MTPDMSDRELRLAYRALLRRRPPARAPVEPERMLELVEGQGEETTRLETLDAVMADSAGAREFELLRALVAARPAPAARWLRPAVLLPLAAAAVLALLAVPVLRLHDRTPGPEPTRDVQAVPELLAPPPSASPAQATRFRWRPVAGARAYVLEILAASGRPVFTTRTTVPEVTLPPDVVLATGAEHWWWVAAELPDGTYRRSPFRRLVVQPTR
jgi:hypothetical protein